MTARPCKFSTLVLASMIMLLFIGAQILPADEPSPQPEEGTAAVEKKAPKTKEERLRELRLEEAEITLKQKEIMMQEKEADFGNMKSLYDDKLVTLQELNDAKKDKEEASLAYEQAKLNLQMWELESLKAAWHITIEKTTIRAEGDRTYMTITLVNTSEKVKLERTQKMIDEKIIDPVDTEVSPEINDIYISIEESGSIISNPYEKHIPSLKLGEPVTLEFELIKDVESVVVSMRYEEQEDKRNIHLKKIEPRITVVKAIKYYNEEDKRMLQVTLRNSAVEGIGEGEKAGNGGSNEEPSVTNVEPSGHAKDEESLNDISNIYIAIRDEQRTIIGIPYEIRIPVLKYKEEKTYTFELKKDVNSVVIAMNYMKQEHEKTIYLEPDTRHISILTATVSVLPNAPYIEPSRRGKWEVTLELVNRSESEGMPSAEELEGITGSSIDATREIRNVYVSLKHNDVVVAIPYETVIRRLEYDKIQKLRFDLQKKDANELTVALSYLNRKEEVNVYLQKVSPEDVVTMSSIGFAQEGTLGSSVEYDLTLQRLAEVERVFKLRLINLSDQFTYRFNDPQANTRVTQVKFTHDQPERKLSLRIYLPEEMDMSLLDKPQSFYAAVLSEEEALKHDTERLTLTPDELLQFKGGRVQLELTPKGMAEFELIAQNLYFPIKTGEVIETLVTLKNIGTRNLENIRLTMDLPSNKWNATIDPELVKKLDRQQETEIKILITPPEDVGVGASELKLKAECEVDNIKVEASPKNLTIKVSSRANIVGTGILIGALILLVVGIAVLTIRLSRR